MNFKISKKPFWEEQIKLSVVVLFLPFLGSVPYFQGLLVVILCFLVFKIILSVTNILPLKYKKAVNYNRKYWKYRFLQGVDFSEHWVTFHLIEAGIFPRKKVTDIGDMKVLCFKDSCLFFIQENYFTRFRKDENPELYEYCSKQLTQRYEN